MLFTALPRKLADRAQHLIGRGDDAARASEELHGNAAVDRQAHVIHHLAHVHLHRQERLRAPHAAFDGVHGERPERDGAQKTCLDALGAGAHDRRMRDARGGAEGHEHDLGVLAHERLGTLLAGFHRLIALETLDVQALELVCRQVERVHDVVLALEAIIEPVSLYEPVFSDGNDTIYVMDQIGDKNDDTTWLEEIAVKEAIANLSDREKRILTMRFFRGKTQMEVASEIGISQAQVSRIEKGALDRIKKNIF